MHWETEAAISPQQCIFQSMETEKRPVKQSMSKNQTFGRVCALQTGPITWTLGAKGVVLLLRLWLWISKIKQQKKRKCNKTKIPQHKNSQNTTTEVCSLKSRLGPVGSVLACIISSFKFHSFESFCSISVFFFYESLLVPEQLRSTQAL